MEDFPAKRKQIWINKLPLRFWFFFRWEAFFPLGLPFCERFSLSVKSDRPQEGMRWANVPAGTLGHPPVDLWKEAEAHTWKYFMDFSNWFNDTAESRAAIESILIEWKLFFFGSPKNVSHFYGSITFNTTYKYKYWFRSITRWTTFDFGRTDHPETERDFPSYFVRFYRSTKSGT